MDAILLLLALGSLAWLAPRYGVDSREPMQSPELTLAQRGFTGGWLARD